MSSHPARCAKLWKQASQRETEHDEQDADHGPAAICGGEPCGEGAHEDSERKSVRKGAVPIFAMRIVAHFRDVVDSQRYLLDHLGQEQRKDAETVCDGGPALVGGHFSGKVEVGE
jgi:hypothetical protein